MKVRELISVLANCDSDSDLVYINSGYDPTDEESLEKIGEAYAISKSTCYEGPIVVLRGE